MNHDWEILWWWYARKSEGTYIADVKENLRSIPLIKIESFPDEAVKYHSISNDGQVYLV